MLNQFCLGVGDKTDLQSVVFAGFQDINTPTMANSTSGQPTCKIYVNWFAEFLDI